jgi:hypothetical protein
MAKKHKISDFRPQRVNANRHTARGLGALDNSIAEGGWLGAITTANDGEVFDGSARLETVYTRFGEEVEPIVIESDGTRPVILKRTDIPNADDPRAKKLALLANRVAEIDLDWDVELLAELNEEIDLSGLFTDDELQRLLDVGNDEGEQGKGGGRRTKEVACVCPNCDHRFVQEL